MTTFDARTFWLASQWYEHGAPSWVDGSTQVDICHLIDVDNLRAPFREFNAQSERHRALAEAEATRRTGYRWSFRSSGSVDALAYGAIYSTVYDALEAGVTLARIERLAAALQPGDAIYTRAEVPA